MEEGKKKRRRRKKEEREREKERGEVSSSARDLSHERTGSPVQPLSCHNFSTTNPYRCTRRNPKIPFLRLILFLYRTLARLTIPCELLEQDTVSNGATRGSRRTKNRLGEWVNYC